MRHSRCRSQCPSSACPWGPLLSAGLPRPSTRCLSSPPSCSRVLLVIRWVWKHCGKGSTRSRAHLIIPIPLQVYGAALQFYEAFPRARLSERQARALGLLSAVDRGRALVGRAVRSRRAIAVLSRWPAFPAFRAFLTFLYRYSVSGPHRLPLEA